MRLGVTAYLTDQTIDPMQLAVELEARGFESMWVAEHTHIPVSRRSAFPGAGEMPEMYARFFDPIVALTSAAAVTERLMLGTAVCLVAQRDPIVLAKQIASLDQLSGGRFMLGTGFGWNLEELENHGRSPSQRWTLVEEHIGAMRALWRDEVAEYRGTLVQLEPSWCWPKPVTPGGPPVFLGGSVGPRTLRHVARYADGWFPDRTGPELDTALQALRAECERQDRDPTTIRLMVQGSAEPEFLAAQAARGVERVLLALPSVGRDLMLPFLDHHAAIAHELNA